MSKIIDKLGIEPLKYVESGPFKLPLYDREEIEEIESERNLLLISLISVYVVLEGRDISFNKEWLDKIQSTIEISCDSKPWSKIKDLL